MGQYDETEQSSMVGGLLKGFGFVLVGIFLLSLAYGFFTVVGAGQRGILLDWGKPIGVFGEGFNWKNPITQGVAIMNVRELKYEVDAEAASKDLQDVHTKVALNYRLNDQRVMDLYRNIGDNAAIENVIVAPAIQESVKASTARFNVEELITQRPAVKLSVETSLKERLEKQGLFIESLSLTDFNFSPEFNKAIEEKQQAQQNALKAKNELESTKIEADKKRTTAQGEADALLTKAKAEAESLKIQSEALRSNPEVLQLRYIEKWNGVLPLVQGGNTPFILDATTLMSKAN